MHSQVYTSLTSFTICYEDVGGKVYHWHITSGKLINTIDEPGNEVFTVDHLEEGALFATAGLDAKV